MSIGLKALMKCGTLVASAAVLLLLLSGSAMAQPNVPALEALGKQVFFDSVSNPPRQSCSSCHVPGNGWTGGVAGINLNGVAIPGADPHTVGGRKPPSNAYASFSPPFGFPPLTNPVPIPPFLFPFFGIPAGTTNPVAFLCNAGVGPFCTGGVFWDGRAEGRGAIPIAPLFPAGAMPQTTDAPSTVASVTAAIIPADRLAAYSPFLGPVADQALGPFPNDVEQNVLDTQPDGGLPGAGAVCQQVQSAKYAPLFKQAYGVDIDCTETGVKTSFQRIALAISAWQHSSEVNSFSSKRDKALAAEQDGHFPLAGLTAQENLGHDLFYGRNDSTLNTGGPNGTPKNAGCAACHNSHGAGSRGEEPQQIYADFAYHHIGVPPNFEVENFSLNGDRGIGQHADPNSVFDPVACAPGLPGPFGPLPAGNCTTPLAGHVKTPTLRNVAKSLGVGFPKAFMHNGYFKTLEQVVHFYNTSIALRNTVNCPAGTTADQAMARGCWPTAEFDTFNQAGSLGLLGNLGLTANEEAAIVAYLKTLTDTVTPKQPAPYRAGK